MRGARVLLAGVVALAGCSEAPAPGKAPKPETAPSGDAYKAAAAKAVEFLRTHQNADGGFGTFQGQPASTAGVTGLVAYALMKSPAKLTEASSPELAKATRPPRA